MKASGRSWLNVFRTGTFATQAAGKPKAEHHKLQTPPQDVKVTKLPNGVIVASLENYAPVSQVSVLYAAGSRHEPDDQIGITHAVRAAATLSNQKRTAFLTAKELQQFGGNLTCTTGREYVQYTVDCLRSDVAHGVQILNNVSTLPVFKPWEVDSLKKQLKLDINLYHHNSDALLIEHLHRAAYRNTLGRSLYMHPNKVGAFSAKDLESFVGPRYVSQGASVAGIGIDHDQLVHMVKKMSFHQGTPPADVKKAKYFGGEIRHTLKSPLVHAALVTEGVALGSPDFLTMSVLQLVLGSSPFVKYGTNVATSKLSKAAQSASSHPVAASCISIGYSDSALFGFQVVAGAKEIGKVLTAVAGAMGQTAKGAVTDADLQRAKKQLKALVHGHEDAADTRLESIGIQALFVKEAIQVGAMEAAIDKVTADQVNQLAKKIIGGKPTYAVVGDLSHTPYLDEVVAARV